MKYSKFLLCGIVAAAGLVFLPACTPSNMPYNITFSNEKTEFVIGEEFSVGENMEVSITFEDESTMRLEDFNLETFSHDPTNKVYRGQTYSIDYSEFDSSKAGNYPIAVIFNDHDDNPENNIRSVYTVKVPFYDNTWITEPSVPTSYDYMETPNVTLGVPSNNANDMHYYIRSEFVQEFTEIEKNVLAAKLSELDAGNYEFKVVVETDGVYKTLEKKSWFIVNRIAYPLENTITDVSMPYTGSVVIPDFDENNAFYIDETNSSFWVDAGEYAVDVVISNTNYKWSGDNPDIKTIKLTITKAENQWLDQSFDLAHEVDGKIGFVQNQFDVEKCNLPESDLGNVMFAIKLQGQDDSQYQDITLEELGEKDPQKYTIKAYVPDTLSYAGLSPITIDFEIFGE